ncbi:MAG: glycosyltransferase family 4 protein [Candidatus Obscuribacterales bacterium]|nr:glycosyltransferase family 4 protein [Candidatus Obscuribacterales bacterium]
MITREYPPDTGFGGIATFSRHLAHGLKSLGHDVEVVSLTRELASLDTKSDDQGVTVHRVAQEWLGERLGTISFCMPYSRYTLMTSSSLWRKFLQLHMQKPFDVVDTPELLAEGFFPALTRALPLVIRLYTPHSKFIAEKLHNVKQSFDHEFVAAIERIAMLSADVLTSPSNDLASFVANDLNYDLESIEIVRNPIDPSQFNPEGEQLLAPNGNLRVLFVGRLEERKGIHYLIDAIPLVKEKFDNVEFVIIGDDTTNAEGQKSVLTQLKKRIQRDGTGAWIKFINRVPLADLPGYYRSADICIVPSVYDNSPYTCLEAMSCGRPVIGTTGGGTAEYLKDEQSGIIVPPRDHLAIAEALINLLGDEEKRKVMGASARQRVLAHFDRKEIARQTAELYVLAQERFAKRNNAALYKKPAPDMLNDAVFMMRAFDQMIYDTLYQNSWRFRIRHWLRIIHKRPRLFVATGGLKLTHLLNRATANRLSAVRKLEAWLSQETALRSADTPLIELLRPFSINAD